MTTARTSVVSGGVLAIAAATAACPALAMPVGTATMRTDIVRVSSWAARAQGKTHTYSNPYGFGYGYGGYVQPRYGAWGGPVYGAPYGYGRPLPPAYGDDGFDAY